MQREMIDISKEELLGIVSHHDNNFVVLDTRDLTVFQRDHLKMAIHLPLPSCLERKQPNFILNFIDKQTMVKIRSDNGNGNGIKVKMIIIYKKKDSLFQNLYQKLTILFNNIEIYIYSGDINIDNDLVFHSNKQAIPCLTRKSSQILTSSITQINEWLFLTGEYGVEQATLDELGIEAIINCALECNKPDITLPCLHLKLTDDGDHCLSEDIIKQVLNFIQGYKKILVFCHAGKSRSVSLVISLLMYKSRLSYRKALAYVRNLRPQADPSLPFTNFLLYWQQLHNLGTPTIVSGN